MLHDSMSGKSLDFFEVCCKELLSDLVSNLNQNVACEVCSPQGLSQGLVRIPMGTCGRSDQSAEGLASAGRRLQAVHVLAELHLHLLR